MNKSQRKKGNAKESLVKWSSNTTAFSFIVQIEELLQKQMSLCRRADDRKTAVPSEMNQRKSKKSEIKYQRLKANLEYSVCIFK